MDQSTPELKSGTSSRPNSATSTPSSIDQVNLDYQNNVTPISVAQDGNKPTSARAATTTSSKRPKQPSRPVSSALAEAKMNARKRVQVSANTSPVIIMKDHLQPARDSKEVVRHATGVIYDMRMVEHKNPWDPTHPEKPGRFTSVIERCQELGLFQRCKTLQPRLATKDELLLQHTQEHIDKLYRVCYDNANDIKALEQEASNYDSIYFHPTTYELSLLSCGSTIELVRNILEGNIQNGMAIIRPPGHHAMKAEYCGYCYFNNVGIAAKHALDNNLAQRILIVDFDVHHGQATQQMFYNDNRVLYFSTHRYEHGMFWPNLEESNYNWIGEGLGAGFNCNIPLNKIGMGNTEFLSIWFEVLLPLAYKFNPDLVIVSAGYDAALGCPEGQMVVAPQCYPHLISPLKGLAGGKIAVVLEGGYCLKSLAEAASLTLRDLLGDPCPLIQSLSNPMPEIVETILNATTMLRDELSLKASKVCSEDVEPGSEDINIHRPTIQFNWNEPKPTKYPTRNCTPYQSPKEVQDLCSKLERQIFLTDLSKAPQRVGLVYDDVMLKHRNFTEPGHPETPARASNIHACHVDFGLLERCYKIPSRKATEEELRLIHTEEHILKMRNTQKLGNKDLVTLQERYNSVYLNSSTNESALCAAGSLLQLLDSVISKECQSGVAIIRPPGHHAEVDEACGFCIYNNVALAAQYALEMHQMKRILILDWDVHHGNGIQRIFERDPRVLYVSIHRYDRGSFFPGSKDANYTKVGKGEGEGFNVNIPWNRSGMGDTEYLAAFINIVLPIAYEFAPELVLVSAGFDAAKGDPLGGCRVTPEGYAHMTHLLTSLANGRVILALEGGYNLTAIAYSMTLCTKALLGDPLPPLNLNDKINESALESISLTLDTHSKYWTLLKPFRKAIPITSPIKPGKYEKGSLADDEKLNELMMEKIEFDNSSENDSGIIPDPPPACGEPSPATLRSPVINIDDNRNPSGSGETINPSPAVPGPSSSTGRQELEGAVGGASTNAQTIQEQYMLMFNRPTNENDLPLYVVEPLTWCPHLESVNPIPGGKIDTTEPCAECQSCEENWICLTCYTVHCSRYIREHMVFHSLESDHKVALSFADLSVWCYGCDSYLDNEMLREAKAAAHRSKFGEEMPGPGTS